MIPKLIHYCWFGQGEMPEMAVKCIESWKNKLSDYQLKEWNESNFDVNSNIYTKEAYEKRKFAFVADYVRLYALYTEGGIYMDTDVEVIRKMDDLLSHCAFMGFETETLVSTGVMGSEKNGMWAKESLDCYMNRHFILENGSLDLTTNVTVITDYLISKGLKPEDSYQEIPDFITVYPKEYFSPKSFETGKIYCTERTYTIHYFAASWYGRKERLFRFCYNLLGRRLGNYFKCICKKMSK